jgi:hypothetical protein
MDIRLTEAGKAASEQPGESLDSDSLFGCLDEEAQAALSDYLGRLITSWEGQLAADEGTLASGPERGGRGFGRRGGFPGFDRVRGPDQRRPPFGGRGFGRPSPDEE